MGLLDKLSSWLGGGRGVPATVLVLGLDNAGKTSLLCALRNGNGGTNSQQHARDSHDANAHAQAMHVTPTIAPQQDHFQSGGVSFSAWDVSGAQRHRALWERHYKRANAIIYVVDAADHLRLVVSREELDLVLSHPDVSSRRLPLLVLANKSDAPHALAPAQVAKALGLERIVCKPWHVCACSALSGAGLHDGLAWLATQLRQPANTTTAHN